MPWCPHPGARLRVGGRFLFAAPPDWKRSLVGGPPGADSGPAGGSGCAGVPHEPRPCKCRNMHCAWNVERPILVKMHSNQFVNNWKKKTNQKKKVFHRKTYPIIKSYVKCGLKMLYFIWFRIYWYACNGVWWPASNATARLRRVSLGSGRQGVCEDKCLHLFLTYSLFISAPLVDFYVLRSHFSAATHSILRIFHLQIYPSKPDLSISKKTTPPPESIRHCLRAVSSRTPLWGQASPVQPGHCNRAALRRSTRGAAVPNRDVTYFLECTPLLGAFLTPFRRFAHSVLRPLNRPKRCVGLAAIIAFSTLPNRRKSAKLSSCIYCLGCRHSPFVGSDFPLVCRNARSALPNFHVAFFRQISTPVSLYVCG